MAALGWPLSSLSTCSVTVVEYFTERPPNTPLKVLVAVIGV